MFYEIYEHQQNDPLYQSQPLKPDFGESKGKF